MYNTNSISPYIKRLRLTKDLIVPEQCKQHSIGIIVRENTIVFSTTGIRVIQ
jgi:hypothetical protein